MKTKTEVQKRLKALKKDLEETERRFDQYDNHDDLELLGTLRSAIDEIEWVLGES